MSYLRGEDVVLGVGAEETRGADVVPQIWIPGRTPSGVKPVLEKVPVKETRGTKIDTNASEITQARAEGDLEFNLRSESIGYLLKSLMGAVDSDPVGGQAGAYDHVFTVLPNDPEHPSLTFALSQPGQQDYKYPLAVVTSIEFKVAPNDLVMATINFIAQKEAEKGAPAYEPTFGSTDVYFRQQDVHFYLADVGDDLAGGAEVLLKDFVLTIPNGGRADQNISEYNPGNVIAGTFAPKGSMTLDELDKTYHDFFTGGTYKALRMSMERLDVTIGSSTHPKLIVDLFKVSVEGWDPDRPIDDVVKQKLELKVHYSEDDAKALEITLRNSTADYDAEPGS